MIPKLPMRDSRLSPEAKAIYAYLCSFAGADGIACPSAELMCKELGMATSHRFFKHRRQLEELGYISVSRPRQENGRLGQTVYTINTNPHVENQQMDKPHVDKPRVENPHVEKPHVDKPHVENQHDYINNSIINNSLINNSFINNSLDNSPHTPQGGNLIETPAELVQEEVVDDSLPAKKYRRDDFVAWYGAYPRQVKKKPAARSWENAIKKKALPSLDFLLADIERQKSGNPRWLDGYVPDPTTYLNERRWNDNFTPRHTAPYQPQPNPQPAPTYDPNRKNWTGAEILAYYEEQERQLNASLAAKKNATNGQAATAAIGE